jgi:hypothetical protein
VSLVLYLHQHAQIISPELRQQLLHLKQQVLRTAFLLAQQWDWEHKRIAPDKNVIAQMKDMTAVHDMMDIRAIEILLQV